MATDKINQALTVLGLGTTAYMRSKYELPRRVKSLEHYIEEGKKGVHDEEIPKLKELYRGLNTGLYDITGGANTLKGQLNVARRTAGSVVDALYKLQMSAYANYALAALPSIASQIFRTAELALGGSQKQPNWGKALSRSIITSIPWIGPLINNLLPQSQYSFADRAHMTANFFNSLASIPLSFAHFNQNINPITRFTSSANAAILGMFGLTPLGMPKPQQQPQQSKDVVETVRNIYRKATSTIPVFTDKGIKHLPNASAFGSMLGSDQITQVPVQESLGWLDTAKSIVSPIATIGLNMLTYSMLNSATRKLGNWLMKPSFSVQKTFNLDRIPIIAKYRTAEDFIDNTVMNEIQHQILVYRDIMSPYEQLSLQLQAQIATSVATIPVLTSEFINNFIERRNTATRVYNRSLDNLENFLEGTSFNNVIQEHAFKLKRGENIHTFAQNVGLALIEVSNLMRKWATLTNIPAQIGMVLSGKKILTEANKYNFEAAQTEKLRKATYINQLGVQEVENFASAYMSIQQSASEILASTRTADEAQLALLSGIYEAGRISALELATIRARGFRITEPINYNKIGRTVTEEYGGGLLKWLANYIPGLGAIYEATKTGQNIIRFIFGNTRIGQLTLDAIENMLARSEEKYGRNILNRVGRGALGWFRTTMTNPFHNRYHDRSYNLLASGFDYYRDTTLLERITDKFLDRFNQGLSKIPILRQLFYQENRISLKERRRMEYAEQVRGRVQEAAERIGLKQLEDQPLFYRYAVTEMPKQFDLMNFYLSGIFMFTQATMRNTASLAQAQGVEGYIAEVPKFKARVLDVYTGRLLTEKELKIAEEDRVRILAQAAEEIARMNEKALSRFERMIGNMRWLQGTDEDINRTRVKEIQKGIEESILYNITKEVLTTDQLWQRQFRYSPATGVSMNIEEYEKSNPITATARKTFQEYGSLRSAWYHFSKPDLGKIIPQNVANAIFNNQKQTLKEVSTVSEELANTVIDVNVVKISSIPLKNNYIPVSIENFDFRNRKDLNEAFAKFIRNAANFAIDLKHAVNAINGPITTDIRRMANAIAGPIGDNTLEGQRDALENIKRIGAKYAQIKEKKREEAKFTPPQMHSFAKSIKEDLENIFGVNKKGQGGKSIFGMIGDAITGALGAIFGGKIAGGAAKSAGGFLTRFIPRTLISGGTSAALLSPYALGAAAIGAAGYGAYKLIHSGPEADLIDRLDKAGIIDYNIFGNSKILRWDAISHLNDKDLSFLINFNDWDNDDLRRLKELHQKKFESIKSSLKLASKVLTGQTLTKENLKKKIEEVKKRQSITEKIANALDLDKRVGTYLMNQLFFGDRKTAELISRLDTVHIIDYNMIGRSQILDWEEISKLPVDDIDRLIKFNDWTTTDLKRLRDIRDTKAKFIEAKDKVKSFYDKVKNKASTAVNTAKTVVQNVVNIVAGSPSTSPSIQRAKVAKTPIQIKSELPDVTGVPLPVHGRISSPFGWRVHPISHTRKFHKGIDIAAPTGTPVQAAMSGKVIRSEYSRYGWGNVITILGDDGKKYLYAHLSARHVRVGDRVERGQVIGLVGSTGRSTGPHLHFQIMDEHNKPLDPITYMKNLAQNLSKQGNFPLENVEKDNQELTVAKQAATVSSGATNASVSISAATTTSQKQVQSIVSQKINATALDAQKFLSEKSFGEAKKDIANDYLLLRTTNVNFLNQLVNDLYAFGQKYGEGSVVFRVDKEGNKYAILIANASSLPIEVMQYIEKEFGKTYGGYSGEHSIAYASSNAQLRALMDKAKDKTNQEIIESLIRKYENKGLSRAEALKKVSSELRNMQDKNPSRFFSKYPLSIFDTLSKMTNKNISAVIAKDLQNRQVSTDLNNTIAQPIQSMLTRSLTLSTKSIEEIAAEEMKRHLLAKMNINQSLQDLYNKETLLNNFNQIISNAAAQNMQENEDANKMSISDMIEILQQLKDSNESLSAQQVQLLATLVSLLTKPENEISAKLSQNINGY